MRKLQLILSGGKLNISQVALMASSQYALHWEEHSQLVQTSLYHSAALLPSDTLPQKFWDKSAVKHKLVSSMAVLQVEYTKFSMLKEAKNQFRVIGMSGVEVVYLMLLGISLIIMLLGLIANGYA